MKKLHFAIVIISFILPKICLGVDVSERSTDEKKIGKWHVIEIANPGQMSYRMASISINSDNATLAFDFIPSKKCVATAAVIAMDLGHYDSSFDGGHLPMKYKIPGEKKEKLELVNTVMTVGDRFAFISFSTLKAETIYKTKSDSKLAVWVAESPDAGIEQSNMYFSLDGFKTAYDAMKKSCISNM